MEVIVVRVSSRQWAGCVLRPGNASAKLGQSRDGNKKMTAASVKHIERRLCVFIHEFGHKIKNSLVVLGKAMSHRACNVVSPRTTTAIINSRACP